MDIFAFPYAFGNSSIFFELKKELSPGINLVPFDYPGHGMRLSEDLLYTIEEIADDAFVQIRDKTIKPYSLLGYSMGCLVVFELFKILRRRGMRLPSFIILMAHDGNGVRFEKEQFCNFGTDDARRILSEYGETSKLVLNNDEMMRILTPIVKADSIALRDYRCEAVSNDESSGTRIIIVRGNKEKDHNCRSNWEEAFKKKAALFEMDGGHFFLFDKERDNVSKFKKIINCCMLM